MGEFTIQYGNKQVKVSLDNNKGYEIATRSGVQNAVPGSVIKMNEAEAKAFLAFAGADGKTGISSKDFAAAKSKGEALYNNALKNTKYQIGSVLTDYGDYERINYTNKGVYINMTVGGQKVDNEHGKNNLFLGITKRN